MFLIDDILKALKANTEAARLETLKQDVKTAVHGSEQIYGAGHGEEKLSHALEYLKSKGYDPDKDMLQPFIEATVYEMNQAKKPKAAPIAVASNSKEFKAKYGKKRFTSANAGQSRILNHIYSGLQINDGIPQADREKLFDIQAIQGKVDLAKDGNRYLAYVRLTEWTVDAFQGAINMRNSLRSVGAHMYQIAATLLCGENLRRQLGDTAKDANIWLWLHKLTVEGYTPQDEDFYMVMNLRKNLAQGLHYMDAYNTLIELIAAEIKIPEYTVFKVEMKSVTALIIAINEALKALREDVILYRTEEALPPDMDAEEAMEAYIRKNQGVNVDVSTGVIIDKFLHFTPEFLKKTLTAFEDIPTEPDQLQPEAVKAVKARLHSIVESGVYAWTTLFSMLKDGV